MKFSLCCLAFAICTHAHAEANRYAIKVDSVFTVGNVAEFVRPHLVASDGVTKLPINVAFDLNHHMPELDTFCANVLGVPVSEILQSGSDIGTEDGMLYNRSMDSFTPVPLPNTDYNSIDTLVCRSNAVVMALPGGTISFPTSTSMLVQNLTLIADERNYPVVLHWKNSTDELCKYYGYTFAKEVTFATKGPPESLKYLYLNTFASERDIYMSHEAKYSEGETLRVLQSLTCQR